jgi:hypothetical protein
MRDKQTSDAKSPRPERKTGAGSEATGGERADSAPPSESGDQHRSGYGGSGGRPVTSSDSREPPRKR